MSNSDPTKTSVKQTGYGGNWVVYVIALLFLMICIVLIDIFTPARSYFAPASDISTAEAPTTSSELMFHSGIPEADANTSLADEWRAVRSDHKIIAHSIARCLGVDIEAMPRNMFSMLLLDLRPDGDHSWRGAKRSKDAQTKAKEDGSAGPSESTKDETNRLTGYEARMLAMSDEIARARLAAARGADDFLPWMIRFGWASVIISAIATALVTLKSALTTQHWLVTVLGGFAIAFSTAATVLTGAKQFWDPTNAYMRNETALLSLRQLHADITLTFVSEWDAMKCAPANGADTDVDFPRWRNTLVSLQSGTLSAPVIVAQPNSIATMSATGEPPATSSDRTGTSPIGEKAADSK